MSVFTLMLLAVGLVVLALVFAFFLRHVYPQFSKPEQDSLRGAFRSAPLLLAFVVTFAVVYWLSPVKAQLIIYGASKMAIFAWMGYWADRLAFRPEDRPHLLEGISRGTAWKRRSLIVAAAILAGGMTP